MNPPTSFGSTLPPSMISLLSARHRTVIDQMNSFGQDLTPSTTSSGRAFWRELLQLAVRRLNVEAVGWMARHVRHEFVSPTSISADDSASNSGHLFHEALRNLTDCVPSYYMDRFPNDPRESLTKDQQARAVSIVDILLDRSEGTGWVDPSDVCTTTLSYLLKHAPMLPLEASQRILAYEQAHAPASLLNDSLVRGLSAVVQRHDLAALRAFQEQGVDLTLHATSSGQNLLHALLKQMPNALPSNGMTIFNLLLDAGVDVNAVAETSETPLELVLSSAITPSFLRTLMATRLLQHQADPNQRVQRATSPLSLVTTLIAPPPLRPYASTAATYYSNDERLLLAQRMLDAGASPLSELFPGFPLFPWIRDPQIRSLVFDRLVSMDISVETLTTTLWKLFHQTLLRSGALSGWVDVAMDACFELADRAPVFETALWHVSERHQRYGTSNTVLPSESAARLDHFLLTRQMRRQPTSPLSSAIKPRL